MAYASTPQASLHSRTRSVQIGLLRASLCAALVLLLAVPASAADREDAAIRTALASGLRPTVVPADTALPHWSLQQRMSQHNVPGVAIAVLRDGKLVHSAGYGTREMGTQAAVNADTLFSVGSVSKVVTAATSLRLVADGTLVTIFRVGATRSKACD
ncbi:serine hydrolase domain-containing protein [Stenotrophomonas sp. Ste96]|uniref:serine hydrolase n=1 Tax=Stenotrophomonas sp. Ste96 TaxID=2926029 RepID=UPI0021CA87E5|nr:serine hydrolase domain-containing protein [Stenotrophomonas sp. Ste96]